MYSLASRTARHRKCLPRELSISCREIGECILYVPGGKSFYPAFVPVDSGLQSAKPATNRVETPSTEPKPTFGNIGPGVPNLLPSGFHGVNNDIVEIEYSILLDEDSI